MADKKLLEFIRFHNTQKTPRSEVDRLLAGSGWSKKEIDTATSELKLSELSPSQATEASPKALPGVGELLRGTFHILKAHTSTIYGVIAISNLSVFLPYITLKIAQASLGISTIAGPFDLFLSQKDTAHTLLVIYLPLLVIFTIIAPIMQILGSLALFHAVMGSNDNIGILDCYRRSVRQFFAYLWIFILLAFITLGGFTLFIIPGIIVMIWTSNTFYILASENIRGTHALVKSKYYAAGHSWGITGRLLVLGILQVLLYGMMSVIFALVQKLVTSDILSVTGSYIITTALTPLPIVYGYLLYNRLKDLKSQESPGKTGHGFLWLGLVGILVIPLLLVLAIILSGTLSKLSPGGQINKTLDVVRQNDMKGISDSIEHSIKDHGAVPEHLSELVPEYLPVIPNDITTNQPYEYARTDDRQDYGLCGHDDGGARICSSRFEKNYYPDLKK